MIQLLGLTVESKAEIKEFVGGVQAQVNRFRKCLELYVVGRKEYVDCYYRVGTVFYTYGESDLIINARDRQGRSKEYKTLRGLVNFLAKQFDSCVEKSVLEKLIQDAIEIDEIEKKKEKELKEMESSIKSRTTEFDIASEFIKEVTGGVWSLQNFEINGYCSAVKDRKLTVNFEVDENYKITKTLGGDMVAHGDWFDLDSNDKRLIEGAKDLQEQLDKMARIDVKLKFDGVHRVYPQEADKIIEERKIKGKFYLRDADKWVGIDNEDGDAWTEEFSSLIECIDWLIGKTFDWVITKWCKSITDSGKDEYVNKEIDKKHMIHRFRLLDDDGIVYAYGVSDDDSSFAPLDYYAYSYGVTEIQYKNKETGEYEVL